MHCLSGTCPLFVDLRSSQRNVVKSESTNYSKRILLVCVSVCRRPFVSILSVCTLFSPKLLSQTSKFGKSSLQWEIAGTAGNPFGKSLGCPGSNYLNGNCPLELCSQLFPTLTAVLLLPAARLGVCYPQGPCIEDVRKIFGILDALPPLVSFWY